jgi:transcriptional regulator with XRE-family HTH domain
MEPGEQIATLREEKALTQVELAEKANISPSTLSQIESGKVPRPHVGTMRKIARALGVEPAELRKASPEEMTARPKGDAPLSFSRWLEERCGHSYLALSEEELIQRFDDLEGFEDAANKKRDLFAAVQAEYLATIKTRHLPPEERVLVRGHHREAGGKWLLAQTLSGQAEGITEAFEQSIKEAIEAAMGETA